MLFTTLIALFALFVPFALAVPTFPSNGTALRSQWFRAHAAPVGQVQGVQKRQGSSTVTISTPLGQIKGVRNLIARRFSTPYAQPPVGALRFANPVAVTSYSGVFDGTVTPNACPQTNYYNPSLPSTNEDCLWLTVYTPRNADANSNLPVMIWLHGGSFASGGIMNPGLDGSKVAATGTIVIFVQYRLGMLGFLRASGIGVDGNYGTRDVQLALQWVQSNIASYGGDPAKVTLAGQSSGASMVKTQLAVSSSDSLFNQFIAHSGTFDYPDQTIATAESVGTMTLTEVACTDLACLRSKTVADLLSAQDNVIYNAHYVDSSVSVGQVYNPVVDGAFVTGEFSHLMNGLNGGLSRKNRKGIFTTVANEQCATVESSVSSSPLPSAYFAPVVSALLAPPQYRADNIVSSAKYDPDTAAPYSGDADATRDALDDLGTDYVFRCATHQSAVNLTASSQGTFYLAQFNVGVPYPNSGSAYCDAKVAHQDDLPLLFASGPVYPSTTAQVLSTAETLLRWTQFIKFGNPNQLPLVTWNPVIDWNHLNMLLIGGGNSNGLSQVTQTFRNDICGPTFWGATGYIPFDSQLYS